MPVAERNVTPKGRPKGEAIAEQRFVEATDAPEPSSVAQPAVPPTQPQPQAIVPLSPQAAQPGGEIESDIPEDEDLGAGEELPADALDALLNLPAVNVPQEPDESLAAWAPLLREVAAMPGAPLSIRLLAQRVPDLLEPAEEDF